MTSDVENELISLIDKFRGRLPDEFADEYISLAQHNECGVAIENLCVQLYEFNVKPTTPEMKKIKQISSVMNLGDAVWNFLLSNTPSE